MQPPEALLSTSKGGFATLLWESVVDEAFSTVKTKLTQTTILFQPAQTAPTRHVGRFYSMRGTRASSVV